MINKIWFYLIVIGLLIGIIYGINMSEVIMLSANDAKDMIFSLMPLIVLWSGIMNIASKSCLLSKFSNVLKLFFKLLFPNLKNDRAMEYISSNVAANMLGLGSAATPYGLKAMEELQKFNKNKEYASDEMITFLVLNTSGVTLIPMSVIAIRMSFNSMNPFEIILPSIIATCFSTIFGLSLDYFIRRRNVK